MGKGCFAAIKIAVIAMMLGLCFQTRAQTVGDSDRKSIANPASLVPTPMQELLAPGSELTSVIYGLLFEAHLRDLEMSSDFYKRVMAATTISVPERRLAFDEFFAWWSVELAHAKTYQSKPIFTRDLWTQYFSEMRLATLSKEERRRAEYVELMLSSFSHSKDATYYALERLKDDEAIANPIQRLRRLSAIMKTVARDDRGLQAMAAAALLFYDFGHSDFVQGEEKALVGEVSLQMLRDVREAAERAGQIDILAPYNLVGGLGLVKLAGPLMARSSTLRFLRYAWFRSTPLQKSAVVGGLTSSVAGVSTGMSALSSMRRGRGRHVSSEAEWVLVGQVMRIANGED